MPRADCQSVGWFLTVGACAGCVHYVVTLGLHTFVALSAGSANVAGFLAAFPVSYLGHRCLSFTATAVPHRHALPRLFLVSSVAFVANQTLLLTILSMTALPLWIALAIVLFVVAFSTYLLSRRWVFARHALRTHDLSHPER